MIADGKPERARRRKTRGDKSAEVPRMKCVFRLETELDVKLTHHARLEGKSRSDVVNKLVADAVAYIVIQHRSRNVDAPPVDDATGQAATSTAA